MGEIESLGKARSSSPENLSLLGLCLQAIYLEQGQQVLSTVTSFFHAPDWQERCSVQLLPSQNLRLLLYLRRTEANSN